MGARLAIAGALWNLVRDPVFLTCLDRLKIEPLAIQIYEVLWLDDERAVDFLIDLLGASDPMVRYSSLELLNSLEAGRGFTLREQFTSGPDDYRRMRLNPAFREHMTRAVRKRNREWKQGMCFGWSEVQP